MDSKHQAGLQFPVQIRFDDIDSYGHVNNVTFLTYLQDARVQLIHRSLGSAAGAGAAEEDTFHDLVGKDNFALVGRHEIEYLQPLNFRPVPVYVNIWVTSVGKSSFEFGYAVAEQDGAKIYAQATSGMVLMNKATDKPIELTQAQHHALQEWSGAPVEFRRRPKPRNA
ncbi:acyl-CoA thioesterase [Arthrobacter castelli]|uniref:acyl-CoA thioesterase n=1 Tax=Arthrobacter castelli TaxID=271431 RepID=UPI0003F5EC4D|nr:acyl-CoA thioesterase [Arthrobacter castelli]